jgi:hypothetical protein
MQITRVYSDAAGESHLGDFEIELRDAGEIGHLSDPMVAGSVIFRRNDPSYDYDWHPAPQRQLVVMLDGAIEIETSDGQRRTFRGGDVILVEDTTGRGHRSRHVEPRERRSIFITLEPPNESFQRGSESA